MPIKIISQKDIICSLEDSNRQYLVGNLKNPQELKHIHDKDLEVGYSKYSEYTTLTSHYHTSCKEYQYVLNGKTKYLDLDTDEEFEICKGDFFVIYPKTKYFQKVLPKTEILFIKYPAGNDKVVVEITEKQKKWGEKY